MVCPTITKMLIVILETALFYVFLTPGNCQQQSGLRFVENLITRLEKQGVSENSKAGTYLGTLLCADDLSGTSFRYYATNTDSINVNQLTGNVTLKKQFDFEQVSNNLDPNVKPNSVTFQCTDNRNDPTYGLVTIQQASVDLTIAVTDFNDNAPKFAVPALGWTLFIAENAAVGTVIASGLNITDADRGANAQLFTLSFDCVQDQDACSTFGISYSLISEGKYTFSIKLLKSLDYETKSEYQTAVYAVDGLGTADVPHLTSSVGLQIIVSDFQDRDPVFKNENNNFQVEEGLPVGSSVKFSLLAQDGDLGARRPIAFDILPDGFNLFRLRPPIALEQGVYSAELEVNVSIDRETLPDGYTFTAKATELQDGNRTNATVTKQFTCVVKDMNDNGPVFDSASYSVQVPEVNTERIQDQIPSFVIVVSDRDEPTNARFQLDIVSQTFADVFGLTPSGVVTGTTYFYLIMKNVFRDYDVPAYRVQTAVIKATEILPNGMLGSQSSTATVTVSLTDINDNSPVFNDSQYVGSVLESAPNFTVVDVSIHASDNDSGRNAGIVYSLQDTVGNIFNIDPVTAVLRVIAPLDYEKRNEYTFQVYATDKGDRPLSSQAQVTIIVGDVNDVAPQFTLPLYTGRVSEASTVFEGTVQVKATSSSNPSANITYRITSGNTPSGTFVLDPITGVVTLNGYLDYESTPGGAGIYSLAVEASDNGKPPLTSTSIIRVTVLDENDHGPEFSPQTYYFTLREDVAAGTIVANLTASDADSGSNGEVKYRIGSGGRDNFDVNSVTGVMRVASNPSFDYDEYKSYAVQVLATDGGSPQRTASAMVYVTVLDANNKPPKFDLPLYTTTCDESTRVGTPVLNVSASDPDTDQSLQYSILVYTIQAQNQQGAAVTSVIPYDFRNMFTVGPKTGVISVGAALDRKYVVEVTFVVQAMDINGQTNTSQVATTRVTISITGTQDVTLRFDNNPVFITVSENQATDKKIYTLQARDPADGLRVVNEYQEVAGTDTNSIFRIDQTTGEVFLTRQLDYDAGERGFSVQVRAVKETRSATVTLSITVSDVNDMAPVFMRASYVFSVSEDRVPPFRIGVIAAQDGDSATFGPIEYTLGLGLNSDDFELFSLPGGDAALQVSKTLDYETRKVYYLTVIAMDNPYLRGSAVRKSASVSVTVSVLDVNDNTPMFRDAAKNFSIPATATIGFPIGKMEAFDLDEGLNGDISYSLQATSANNTPLSLFTIDMYTGVLQTQASLSGQNQRFDLRVVATDKGVPARSSALPITIKVQGTEEDDGTPQWFNFVNNLGALAPEHQPNFTLPVRATAVPRTPKAVSVYSLIPFGQDYQYFSVDSRSGEIVVRADLDREIQENYTLVIAAADSLNSTLVSRRTLIVSLQDKDDNGPSFQRTKYAACPTDFEVPTVVYADDNTPAHTIIAYAKACDPDGPPNNQMIYERYMGNNSGTNLCHSFDSGALQVNANGSIESTVMLDYEEHQEYLVCILVRAPTSADRVKREFSSRQMIPNDAVGYIVVKLRDVNDNGPTFPNDTLTAVLQTTPTSDIVVQVAAVDPDGPQNNRVVYSIENTMYYPPSGPPYGMNGAFVINPNTGIVSINLPSYKDFADGYFSLTIKAVDYLDSRFSDTMQLQIVLHERVQVLRIVMDLNPGDGNYQGRDLISDLNKKGLPDTAFFLLSISEHRTLELPVATQTDVCFVIVSNNQAYSPYDGIALLDMEKYREVLSKTDYKEIDRGTCYLAQSSESQVKWRDLWWVLVAIAIFLFICCIILLVTLFILYDRYKDQMRTPRMYMVQK